MEELARVYARSLFEVAREQGKLDELREQLGQFADALDARAASWRVFFFSPYFSTSGEAGRARRGFSTAPTSSFVNFLKLLIENHRMPVIFRIRQRVRAPVGGGEPDAAGGDHERDRARPGDDREPGRAIGERTGRKVKLAAHVDPDILGGIVLRVGNSILDASIRNRLEQLRRHVAQGAS